MSSITIAKETYGQNNDGITFLCDTGFFSENRRNSKSEKGKRESKSFIRKKADGGEERVIQGYANVKIVDHIGDFIYPTAFAKSLPDYLMNGVLRFNHDEGSLIGHVTDAVIDDYGLWIEATIGNWPLADEKWKQIEHGSLKALSIMGRTVDFEEKQITRPDGTTEWIWEIYEFELIEISVVEIPMNKLSLFEKKGYGKGKAIHAALSEMLKSILERPDIKRLTLHWRIKNLTKKNENEEPSTEVVVEDDIEEKSDDVEVVVEETIAPESKAKMDEDEEEEKEDCDDEKAVDVNEQILKDIAALVDFTEGVSESMKSLDERLTALEGAEKSFKKTTVTTIKRSQLQPIIQEMIAEELKDMNLEEKVEEKKEAKKLLIKTGELDENTKVKAKGSLADAIAAIYRGEK
jgi:HK97 family phage prohead protease